MRIGTEKQDVKRPIGAENGIGGADFWKKAAVSAGECGIWGVAAIFILILLIFNLIYRASVGYSITELVTIGRTSPVSVVAAATGIVTLAFVQRYAERLTETQLFRFFVILYLIAGAYWILNISPVLRADALHIQDAARMAEMGDFSFLEPGQDIRNHPWQLGMVTYERVLGHFSRNVQLLFLANLAAIIGINYFTWKTADLVFLHDRKTNIVTIVFSFCFLPQFFFLTFAYGLVPGFFCLTGAFYFQERCFSEKRVWPAAVSIALAAVAVFLKGNYAVGVIAMAILFFLQALREWRLRYLVMILVLMVCIRVTDPILRAAYEYESGTELNVGEPKLLYVAMGILPENRGMAPGWYCGYNDYTFGIADFDPETANEMAKESIAESLRHYAKDPADAAEFFSGKIASVWCEPMYQSLWTGPLEDSGQTSQTRMLASLYHGAGLERLVSGYMKVFLLMLCALSAGYVFDRRNRRYAYDYALLYFAGGFLLHIFWEGKSQYVYHYVFILIPGCARALVTFGENMMTWLHMRKKGAKDERDQD